MSGRRTREAKIRHPHSAIRQQQPTESGCVNELEFMSTHIQVCHQVAVVCKGYTPPAGEVMPTWVVD